MDFPPFWARAVRNGHKVWRWSHNSLQDATRQAEDAAEKLAAHWQRFGHHETRKPDAYAYGTKPLREQVLNRIQDSQGHTVAVVTRNKLGCRILNTARVVFVDIDIPNPTERSHSISWIRRLFAKPKMPDTQVYEREAPWLRRAEAWTQGSPGWGWRVYRTFGGLRLLATHQVFDPEDPIIEHMFEATGADPLYRALCRRQKCFRARLTPKAYRLGLTSPQDHWPYPTIKSETRFDRWEARYKAASEKRATCQWIARFGSDVIHPEVALILAAHDQPSRATINLPLA